MYMGYISEFPVIMRGVKFTVTISAYINDARPILLQLLQYQLMSRISLLHC